MQVQVYQHPVAGKAGSDEEQYDIALAFLTSGFSSCVPNHIEMALTLLKELDNRLEPTTGRCRPPLCIETSSFTHKSLQAATIEILVYHY